MTLDAATYWKLRFTIAEAQRCLVEATVARNALQIAQAHRDALMREAGLDPKAASWTLDDDTLTVTTPDAPP